MEADNPLNDGEDNSEDEEYTEEVTIRQCDHIWRKFANLANSSLKVLNNFWRVNLILLFWQIFMVFYQFSMS